MAKTIAVTVEIVPTSGDPTTKTVEVAPTGAKVSDVLNAAGISGKKQDISVNGRPATLDTFVMDGQRMSTKPKRTKVRVAERVAVS